MKHAKPATVEGEWMYPENPSDFGFWKENCYVKVQNYKEEPVQVPADDKTPLGARTLSLKDADKAKMMQSIDQSQELNVEPPFEIEKIPTKTILVPTLNP